MRIRTADILLAKQTLYQLSYTPLFREKCVFEEKDQIVRCDTKSSRFFSCFLGAGPCGHCNPICYVNISMGLDLQQGR